MIPTTSRRSPVYVGTGAPASYAFAFKVFSKSDIAVLVTNLAGIASTLTLDVDYTVTLNADQDNFPGGSVTPTVNLPLGHQLVSIGSQAFSQTTQLPNGGAYNAVIVERAMDRLAIVSQQLKEVQARTLKLPASDAAANDLAAAAQRIDRVLGFNVVSGQPEMSVFTMTQLASTIAAAYAGAAGPLDALSFIQSGPGSVTRSGQDKMRERISVLDKGALRNGATDDTPAFQLAADQLAAAGGGVVWAPGPGTYKLAGQLLLSSGVSLEVDPSAVIDCRAGTSDYSVRARGTIGVEVAISAVVTSGDVVVPTVTPHGLAVGDWFFLKSQRACLHADAGTTWRLGETTAGASQPFFAEPLQVLSVDSPTQVTATSKVIFPDYRPNNSLETYPGARASATIAKINWLTGVRIVGGKWLKSDNQKGLIRLTWCFRPFVDIHEMQLGASYGVGIYAEACFGARIKACAARPADWLLGALDHSLFNSFKDVGSWYCQWDVEDINGSQGWDQSYLNDGHPCIGPKLKMRSVNSHEDGATTHGGCYGADIEVEAFGPHITGFRNRARFSRIKLRVHGESTGASAGLILNGWGGLDTLVHDSYFNGTPLGIDVNPEGVTDTAPAEANLQIDNIEFLNITSGALILLRDRAVISTDPSLVSISNIKGRDVFRGIYVGAGWHGGTINGYSVTRMSTAVARYGVELRPDAAGWTLRDIRGFNIGAGNTLVKLNAISTPAVATAFSVAVWLDEPSIQLHGSGTKLSLPGTGHAGYLGASGAWTPVFTADTNSTPGAPVECMYSIDGDVVTVSGQAAITAPAAGQCRTRITTPTIQNFTSNIQAAGTAVSIGTTNVRTGAIFADTVNDVLIFEWYATGAAETRTFAFTAQYRLMR